MLYKTFMDGKLRANDSNEYTTITTLFSTLRRADIRPIPNADQRRKENVQDNSTSVFASSSPLDTVDTKAETTSQISTLPMAPTDNSPIKATNVDDSGRDYENVEDSAPATEEELEPSIKPGVRAVDII